MTGFSNTSGWMLPLLLLPIFIILHHSSVVQGVSLHEFGINVYDFGLRAKNCSKNCSLVHVNDKICRCLNLTMSPGECGFPHHYIKGLRSLLPAYDSLEGLVDELILNLQELNQRAQMKITVCSRPVMSKPILTTNDLAEALEELKQKINSRNNTTG
ncbi:unnamed protein product [Pleuronectes platessa]|uniref:Uncharacterized protein n=1 Tax=Pleuronectes platessa TaxID=8262 RepID=A0A9N7UUP8_PLEPL|nr:unnamed protein product [Pleuronectes platessa]